MGGWGWDGIGGSSVVVVVRTGDSKNTQNPRDSKKLCPKNPKMARIDPFLKNDISQPKMEGSSFLFGEKRPKGFKNLEIGQNPENTIKFSHNFNDFSYK